MYKILLFCFKLFETSPRVERTSQWQLRKDIRDEINESFDNSGIYEKYISNNGMSNANYIRYTQLKRLNAHILKEFDDLVSLLDVPNPASDRTYLTGEYHQVLKFGKGPPDSPTILINAGHHSRELTSIQMVCYSMLRLLFEYEQEKTLYSFQKEGMVKNLLESRNVLFIPVVNIDGFYKICQMYDSGGELEFIRKNMH